MIDIICKDKDCFLPPLSPTGLLVIPYCDPDEFDPLWFQIDLHWYKLAPNSYLLFLGTDFLTGTWYCEIRLNAMKNKRKEYGVLGINFLENYMQYHDVTLN